MTQKLPDLDLAIDVVAKRLTHVEDDQIFAAKIVAALPERTTWFGWWMPRLAGAAILLAVVLASVRLPFGVSSTKVATNVPQPPDGRSTNVQRSFGERSTVVAANVPANDLGTLDERSSNVQRTRVKRPSNESSNVLPSDHEFSLPALPGAASIELAPLAIADLPLIGEFPDGMKE